MIRQGEFDSVRKLLDPSDFEALVNCLKRLDSRDGRKSVSIGTTSNVSNPSFHLAPTREFNGETVETIILRDTSLVSPLVRLFGQYVDRVFIDMESKSRSWSTLSLGHVLEDPKVVPFKPNDLAVQVAEEIIAQKVRGSIQPRVAIFGVGNIGFKLALRLLERNFIVCVSEADREQLEILNATQALLRGSGEFCMVDLHSESVLATIDCLVGATPGVPAIFGMHVDHSPSTSLLLDVGNGSFDRSAVEAARRSNRDVHAVDASWGWEAFALLHETAASKLSTLGRRYLANGLFIVSRGVVGALGDVIVDDLANPRRVIGVCNGAGDLLYGEDSREILEKACIEIEGNAE